MRWSRTVVTALVAAFALAGCTGPGRDVDDPTDTPTSAPSTTSPPTLTQTPMGLAPFSFHATDCASVTWQHIEDFSVLNDILAPGFVAADVADLLKVDGTPDVGQGSYGPVSVLCQDNDVTHAPFSLVFPGVLVQPPLLEDGPEPAWIDGYEIAVWVSDPDLADVFEAFHWTVFRGLDLAIDVSIDEDLPNPGEVSRVPEVRAMSATGTLNGTELFTSTGTGTGRYHTFDPDGGADAIRFWIDSPGGLSYVDTVVTEHGTSGSADCTYSDAQWRQWFDRDRCEAGQTLSIYLNGFDLTSTLVHLPGVHA